MQDQTSFLRHALLGATNGLKLSTAALQIPMPVAEQAEFLEDVLLAADKLIECLDAFEALTPINSAE